MLLEASDSWAESNRNFQSLLELDSQLTDEEIIRVVDIVLNNDQILSSFAARPYIKNFFSRHAKIIPKEKFEKFFDAIK